MSQFQSVWKCADTRFSLCLSPETLDTEDWFDLTNQTMADMMNNFFASNDIVITSVVEQFLSHKDDLVKR